MNKTEQIIYKHFYYLADHTHLDYYINNQTTKPIENLIDSLEHLPTNCSKDLLNSYKAIRQILKAYKGNDSALKDLSLLLGHYFLEQFKLATLVNEISADEASCNVAASPSNPEQLLNINAHQQQTLDAKIKQYCLQICEQTEAIWSLKQIFCQELPRPTQVKFILDWAKEQDLPEHLIHNLAF